MSEYPPFQWGHMDDLPESEYNLDETGGWSDRFAWWKQVGDIFDSKTLSVTLVGIDPGQATPMHAHTGTCEEFYVVLAGTTDVEVKDPETGEVEVVEGAKPGTIAYFPPGVEHRPKNPYDEQTVELGFRTHEGTLDSMPDMVYVPGSDAERPALWEGKEAQWSHYEDLPDSETVPDIFTEWKLVSEAFGTETMSVSAITIAPGEAGPMHSHPAPVEEYYYIHEGNVDIEVTDPETGEVELIEADAGSIFYFPPDVEHRPINRYDEPAVEIGFRTLGDGDEASAMDEVAAAVDESE
ncbi:MAG: cupin domain-containing protein [Halobacteriota archaeon]